MKKSIHYSISPELSDTVLFLCETSVEIGVRFFLVGGFVRDLLRQVPCHDNDLDILVDGSAIKAATYIASKAQGDLTVHERFLTAKVTNAKKLIRFPEVDFASAREEVYESPGDLPKVSPSTIELDLKRRDFSINALALPIEALVRGADEVYVHDVVDYFNGIQDLQNRLIRVLHNRSFEDDPTRLFRAMRYLGRMGASLEVNTEALFDAACRKEIWRTVSPKRRFNEIVKIVMDKEPKTSFLFGQNRGIWSNVFNDLNIAGDEFDLNFGELATKISSVDQYPQHSTSIEDLVLTAMLRDHDSTVRDAVFKTLGISNQRRNMLLQRW